MSRRRRVIAVVAMAILAAGCGPTGSHPFAYDALHDALRARQCLEREETAFCDDYFEHSFQTYQQEREREERATR